MGNFSQKKAISSLREVQRVLEGWGIHFEHLLYLKHVFTVHTYHVCACLERYHCETIFDNVKMSSYHD